MYHSEELRSRLHSSQQASKSRNAIRRVAMLVGVTVTALFGLAYLSHPVQNSPEHRRMPGGGKEEDSDTGGLDIDEKESITLISCEDEEPASFTISRKSARMCIYLKDLLDADKNADNIALKRADRRTLALIVEYLKHYDGKVPAKIDAPIPFSQIIGSTSEFDMGWARDFIRERSDDELEKIVLAADCYNIPSLLDFACAHIATNNYNWNTYSYSDRSKEIIHGELDHLEHIQKQFRSYIPQKPDGHCSFRCGKNKEYHDGEECACDGKWVGRMWCKYCHVVNLAEGKGPNKAPFTIGDKVEWKYNESLAGRNVYTKFKFVYGELVEMNTQIYEHESGRISSEVTWDVKLLDPRVQEKNKIIQAKPEELIHAKDCEPNYRFTGFKNPSGCHRWIEVVEGHSME